jgi:hypothetical protein
LWRYNAYSRYYPNDAITEEYRESLRETLSREPRWLDHQLAKIREDLEQRPPYVFANRDRLMTWEDVPIPAEQAPDDATMEEVR